MPEENALIVRNLHKSFRLPHEQHSRLKDKLLSLGNRGKKGYENQHVLKGVNFEIKKGEFFGIVGRNGSGKSTLLKTLAGIYAPDKGEVKVNGTLVPFIELGVGFNPELSGRDNVYLNGALLGFSRWQIDEMYEDIVNFAELERFMDQKLKNYSSGMQVRLAFSIAIRAEGDILLLDEVLAVGDEAFQRKCQDYFSTLRHNNKTVILVSHNMGAVEAFCTRALFLDEGKIKEIGDPNKIASAYSRSNDETVNVAAVTANVSGITATLHDTAGHPCTKFTSGEGMTVNIKWSVDGVENVGVAIYKLGGEYIYGTNTFVEKQPLSLGKKSISYDVDLPLGEGTYFIKVGLFGENDSIRIDFEDRGMEFIVNRRKNEYRWGGLTKLNSKWRS